MILKTIIDGYELKKTKMDEEIKNLNSTITDEMDQIVRFGLMYAQQMDDKLVFKRIYRLFVVYEEFGKKDK